MEYAKLIVYGSCVQAVAAGDIPAGAVGGTVSVSFQDPIWDGLIKMAVFDGCVTWDVIIDGEIIEIPPEVVAHPCGVLRLGIYGLDPEGNRATPTFMAQLGRVRPGANPYWDRSTDPSLPVWGQILAKIGDLSKLDTEARADLVSAINELAEKSGGEISDEQIAEAVADYLAENPVQAGATAEQAAQIQANTEAIEQLQQSGGGTGSDGADGEDGGYYTPAVTQPDANTMEFHFTPSKADMPAVAAQRITLPNGGSSGNGTSGDCGLTDTVKTALLTILDGVIVETSKQEAIAQALATLKQLWSGGEVYVSQSGTTLAFENVTAITSITQNGTVLALA